MWLINAVTLQLEQFLGSEFPKYAILSHTWEDDQEVTFQEFSPKQISSSSKKGYVKIKETCIRALRHDLKYAWVDTCCIDKASSAELTESINSMFQWYQKADQCFVYLSDFCFGATIEEDFAACRWFKRGWTLQELIAPKKIRFYGQKWHYIGSKSGLAERISSITSIEINVLTGETQPPNYSVACRMSWAARRETKRIEDLAYCLLGLFDVNMPLIYGEGSKSFRRLQEAIVQQSNDLTIFAWDYEHEQEQGASIGLFSPSPSGFARCQRVRNYNRWQVDPVFAITNKGLRFEHFGFCWKKTTSSKDSQGPESSEITRYYIPLGYRKQNRDVHFSL
ncbi:hypothetical protein EG329_008689 [Mollisiaceae sp. DMI_Dod_QoI]|nr:hypothetical protein EG329_008689 [Helotiales sp. DMI_Dod_QoI]